MSVLRQRGGEVRIRVGGNTQESAALVDTLPNGAMILKQPSNLNDPVGDILLHFWTFVTVLYLFPSLIDIDTRAQVYGRRHLHAGKYIIICGYQVVPRYVPPTLICLFLFANPNRLAVQRHIEYSSRDCRAR